MAELAKELRISESCWDWMDQAEVNDFDSDRASPQMLAGGGSALVAQGKQVFESAGCTSCHTLKDANATGTVGPNLDDVKPSRDKVVERVTNGKGVMPSFKGDLSDQEIADVAQYVFESTH